MKKFIAGLIALSIISIYGINTFAQTTEEVADGAMETVTNAIESLARTEAQEITSVEVRHELIPLGELVTYSLEYAGQDEIKDSEKLWNHNIPGSTHTIDVAYEGVIKVGYNFSEIEVDVDNETHKIHITLPEPKIISNGIDDSSVTTTEETTIFSNFINPIESDEVTNRLAEIESEKLEAAKAEDKIYDHAETNAKDLIAEALKSFKDLGYEIAYA